MEITEFRVSKRSVLSSADYGVDYALGTHLIYQIMKGAAKSVNFWSF